MMTSTGRDIVQFRDQFVVSDTGEVATKQEIAEFMVKIKPIGKSPTLTQTISRTKQDVLDSEIDMMPFKQAIVYLRVKPKGPDDTFPWPLVERFVTDQTGKTPKRRLSTGIYRSTPVIPEPMPGFEWYWVDDMALLSGRGGYLEVNISEKKQGRFLHVCRS